MFASVGREAPDRSPSPERVLFPSFGVTSMIARENLLDLICTEAFEHAGVPEVPEHKHGGAQNYSALKREARGAPEKDPQAPANAASPVRYQLELVRAPGGALEWHE